MIPFVTHAHPNEHVVLVLRRHWFTVLHIILTAGVLFLLPIGVHRLLLLFTPGMLTDPRIAPILSVLAVIYYLAVWLFSFTDFVDYYLDTWVITTARLINIEQHGLFRRTASELNLSSIQDVTSEISGPLQTFFHYGDVYVQTAAEQQRFHLKLIPQADVVKETLMQLAEEDRLKERGTTKT